MVGKGLPAPSCHGGSTPLPGSLARGREGAVPQPHRHCGFPMSFSLVQLTRGPAGGSRGTSPGCGFRGLEQGREGWMGVGGDRAAFLPVPS